jgi:cytochrome c biogenesis protein CcdA
LAQAYNTEIQGVPTIFINDKVIVGFSNSRAEEIEQEVTYCSTNHCEDPLNRVEEQNNGFIEKLTLPAVIGAAAVDAINPCAFAVLIILLTTILISGNKKRAFLAGIAFITAIYISYFLMGLGLYTAIHATGLTNTFYTVVAVLAILLGLFNLKDFFWYGKGFVMEVPLKWRPAMKKIIRNVTSIKGAFLIGFVVSIFLLPCTSGPYIVILGLLSEVATRSYAISLLLIYNLIFILPMVGITLAVYFGLTTTEKAEEWRQKRLKSLHLLAGLILIILGIFMFIAMNNGWI